MGGIAGGAFVVVGFFLFFFLDGLCLVSHIVDGHGSQCNRSRSFCRSVGKSELVADRNRCGGGDRRSAGGGRSSGGAVSSDCTSAGAGELGALEAMELGRTQSSGVRSGGGE